MRDGWEVDTLGWAVWQDAVRSKKRLFVCGLALDFCVLDTCLNAGSSCMRSACCVWRCGVWLLRV